MSWTNSFLDQEDQDIFRKMKITGSVLESIPSENWRKSLPIGSAQRLIDKIYGLVSLKINKSTNGSEKKRIWFITLPFNRIDWGKLQSENFKKAEDCPKRKRDHDQII